MIHASYGWILLLQIVELFASAASALPFIITLGLIAGRKGNGQFCLAGSLVLATLALVIAPFGLFLFAGSYVFQVSQLSTTWPRIISTIFQTEALPWVSSFIAWCLGCVFLLAGRHFIQRRFYQFHDSAYQFSLVRAPVIFLLSACLCFLATYILRNWPFAGLPVGLSWDRAIMAILRNAMRHYFMAFSPAGALGLLAAGSLSVPILRASPQFFNGIRWLSFWAAIGYLPYATNNWGLIIGISFSNAPLMSTYGQIASMIFLTVAILGWFWILFRPRHFLPVAWLAFFMLLFKILAPHLLAAYDALSANPG